MIVTVICDASVSGDCKVGGYGFYVVSDRGRHTGSGAFKEPVKSSCEAEMKAAINAVYVALSLKIAEAGDTILIQTDSTGAITMLSEAPTRKQRGKKAHAALIDRFKAIVVANKLVVSFRHIKGHNRQDQSDRGRVQRAVDVKARSAMRAARKERKQA